MRAIRVTTLFALAPAVAAAAPSYAALPNGPALGGAPGGCAGICARSDVHSGHRSNTGPGAYRFAR
jgi:hypothetical protein